MYVHVRHQLSDKPKEQYSYIDCVSRLFKSLLFSLYTYYLLPISLYTYMYLSSLKPFWTETRKIHEHVQFTSGEVPRNKVKHRTWYTARSSGGVGTLYVSIKSYSSLTTVASLSMSSTYTHNKQIITVIYQANKIRTMIYNRICNKILDCHWSSAYLFLPQLAHRYIGIHLQLSNNNF